MCNQSKCECSMTEHAKALAKLKVGDKILITRRAERGEKGWENTWTSDMTPYVGKEATVVRLHNTNGVRLDVAAGYDFPAHVLELVISEQPKAHIHAASMKLYAEDAAETDKPWERWEFSHNGTSWYSKKTEHPKWEPKVSYRRKRKMRVVNGFSVAAPETKAPEHGTKVFVSINTASAWFFDPRWGNDSNFKLLLSRGLIFLNKDDAIANAKAMCFIDPTL